MNAIFRTNAGKIAARMTSRSKVVNPALIRAQENLGKKGLAKFRRYSSATAYKITGNPPFPYSQTSPSPPISPFYLNIQSGKLLEGWRYRTLAGKDGPGTTFYNLEDYVRYFSGTKLMIQRAIFEQVLKELQPDVAITYHKSYWDTWAKEQGD